MDVVPRRQSRRGVGAEEVIKRAKALEQLMVEGQNGRRDRVFHRREVFPQRLLWALDLVEKNVGELYARSPDGWNAKNKKRELASDEVDVDDAPVAFCCFRYTLDDGLAVVYIYELHVEPKYQYRGLGSHLLHATEQVAISTKISKLVLTVFKDSKNAIGFYQAHGFSIDTTSPSHNGDSTATYEILSKLID